MPKQTACKEIRLEKAMVSRCSAVAPLVAPRCGVPQGRAAKNGTAGQILRAAGCAGVLSNATDPLCRSRRDAINAAVPTKETLEKAPSRGAKGAPRTQARARHALRARQRRWGPGDRRGGTSLSIGRGDAESLRCEGAARGSATPGVDLRAVPRSARGHLTVSRQGRGRSSNRPSHSTEERTHSSHSRRSP
jgi:hypothetical protein